MPCWLSFGLVFTHGVVAGLNIAMGSTWVAMANVAAAAYCGWVAARRAFS